MEPKTIQHDGKTIKLTQEAYADCNVGASALFVNREPIYRAHGVDDFGNEYRITWVITGDVDGDDASNACDWDNPTLVEKR